MDDTMNGSHITPEVVQSVRDAVDIVDVASQMTTLKKRGKRHIGLCPFHKEKTPSFSVDPDQGLYYCFGCGAGGDAIGLWMEQSGDEFPEAIEALARLYGIPLPERSRAPGAPRPRDLTKVLEIAQSWFQRQLERSDFARSYLDEREIPPELRRRFGLGFAPDGWHNLLDDLRREVKEDDLLDAGLVARSEKTGNFYDRFRLRLMFPIHAPSGRLVGFGGRTLGDDRAKYVNTAETEAFQKSRLLYGFHKAKKAIRDSNRVVLAEGYLDVIALVAAGIEEAAGVMGTSLTTAQAKVLSRYTDNVILAFDGDEAGREASRRAMPLLLRERLEIYRVQIPEEKDPDSVRIDYGPEILRQLVENPVGAVREELVRLIGDKPDQLEPVEKARIAGSIIDLLKHIPDQVTRSGHARLAAHRLGIPEAALRTREGLTDFTRQWELEEGIVRSAEEQIVSYLLHPEFELPRLSSLPEEAAFQELVPNRLFSTYCVVLAELGVPPSAEEVRSRINTHHELDTSVVARILIDNDLPPNPTQLFHNAVSLLMRRLKREIAGQVQMEMRKAQIDGDQERLDDLLNRKTELNRYLHRRMTGSFYPQKE